MEGGKKDSIMAKEKRQEKQTLHPHNGRKLHRKQKVPTLLHKNIYTLLLIVLLLLPTVIANWGTTNYLYDNIDDSSIDWTLWSNASSSATNIAFVEDTDSLNMTATSSTNSVQHQGFTTAYSLPPIEEIYNLTFKTRIHINSANCGSGSCRANFRIFNESIMFDDTNVVGAQNLNKDTVWTVIRNESCGEQCFGVYNDGSLENHIIAEHN